MRSHPDWNAENIPFADSAAARRMVEQSIPFVNNSGVESGKGVVRTGFDLDI